MYASKVNNVHKVQHAQTGLNTLLCSCTTNKMILSFYTDKLGCMKHKRVTNINSQWQLLLHLFHRNYCLPPPSACCWGGLPPDNWTVGWACDWWPPRSWLPDSMHEYHECVCSTTHNHQTHRWLEVVHSVRHRWNIPMVAQLLWTTCVYIPVKTSSSRCVTARGGNSGNKWELTLSRDIGQPSLPSG